MTIAITQSGSHDSAGMTELRADPAPGRTPFSRLTVATALVAIIALAVLVRVPYLTTRSIWYDEASSWQTASFPLAELPRRLRLNVHLPLYYAALKGWMAVFGDSVLALRGFSVTFGAATIGAIYLFAREAYLASRLARRGAVGKSREATALALAAAMTGALSAYQINASIEARMYSLGTALTALGAWLVLRAVRGARWSWTSLTASSAALLYCHPYALFTVAVQTAFLFACAARRLARGRRRRAWWLAWRAGLSAAVLAAVFLPGLMLLRSQHKRVRRDYWIQPLNAQMLASTLVQFALPVYADRRPRPYAEALAMLALLAAATRALARHARHGDAFLLAGGLGPMALAALASLKTPIWEGRYFRFAHVFLIVMAVLAIWRRTPRSSWRRAALFGVFACALSATDVVFWKLRDIPDRQGMHGAMQRILTEYRPAETLVADSYIHYFPAKYYAPPGTPVRLLDSSLQQFWGGHLIDRDDLISQDQLAQALTQGVWFLNHRPATSDITYQSNPGLRGAIVEERFASEYDFGVPPWTVHVAHCAATTTTPRAGAPSMGRGTSSTVEQESAFHDRDKE